MGHESRSSWCRMPDGGASPIILAHFDGLKDDGNRSEDFFGDLIGSGCRVCGVRGRKVRDLVGSCPDCIADLLNDLLQGSFHPIATETEMPSQPQVPEWCDVLCKCRHCGHIDRLNRRVLAARFGKGQSILRLAPRMRCEKCENRDGNAIFIGKPRR